MNQNTTEYTRLLLQAEATTSRKEAIFLIRLADKVRLGHTIASLSNT